MTNLYTDCIRSHERQAQGRPSIRSVFKGRSPCGERGLKLGNPITAK
uniref:Uncharacterized protein n=1 Tax=Siphoviridae sp. ct7es18 TaxID=2826166 RepID=A0A8S5MHP4_9CAUD|nr:MAG TPA: hypothetical protein [Siphoviridae sp. ct7es18]